MNLETVSMPFSISPSLTPKRALRLPRFNQGAGDQSSNCPSGGRGGGGGGGARLMNVLIA